jgi:stage II sporulation protein D
VGAYADPVAAARVREALAAAFGPAVAIAGPIDDNGLTRVRVRWPGGEPANAAETLAGTGFGEAFVVPGGGQVVVEDGQGRVVSSAGEVLLEPAGDYPTAVGSNRYRGRFRARVAAGELLVVNELNLERYLRGVVPVEMGPYVFPELEALKAQAVAARTYAVAHLGDHDDEGYDICDTPACQVYEGADVEHRLSDRAVRETAGLIAVYDGRPIDAMYTSTCGGHTEDAAELFSGRAQPYLRGVPCAWDRPLELAGETADGPWLSATDFAAAVACRVLGVTAHPTPSEVLSAVATLAGAGLPTGPATADVEGFSSALLAAAGLEHAAVVLTPGVYALERLLFLTDLYRVPLDPPVDGLAGSWAAAAALAALEVSGVVDRDHGEAVPRPGGVGIFPRRAAASEDLPPRMPIWERWQGGLRERSSAHVLPGTGLERLRRGDEVLALIVHRSAGDGEADRRSAWREWVREVPWTDLSTRLGVPDLERIEITRRTDHGRVVGLAAVGASGTRRTWQGFDVRRALDLPETLFTVHVVTARDGARAARFLGRGWGHGVGLCQNGAYGLARSGMTFDRILGHYYSGVSIVAVAAEGPMP